MILVVRIGGLLSTQTIANSLVGSITSLWKKAAPLPVEDRTTEREDLITGDSVAGWGSDTSFFNIGGGRQKKYQDYDEMDEEVVELSSSLDVYADFVVSGGSETDETFSFDSENKDERLKDVINAYEKRTRIKQRVWSMARYISKYGDCFYEIVASPVNVVKLVKLPVSTMYYNFDSEGVLNPEFPYCQKEYEGGEPKVQFAPWEIIHWKIGEDLYGVDNGILSKLRRAYRIQRMLEDSLLVKRLTNAQQKLIYNVDVSGLGVSEAVAFIKKLKKLNARRRFINSEGKLKEEENPLAPQGDIYQPVRKGGVGDVKVVQSDTSVNSIADVEHFHNKYFTGTKVPKAYLGYERDVNAKATLVQQSLSFIKVVRRIRQVTATGLKKPYSMEFILQGIDPESFEWGIRFPGFGVADEELKWKIEQYKSTCVRNYIEAGIKLSSEWIIRHVMFDLTKSEADQLLALVKSGDVAEPARWKQGAPGGTATGRMPDGGKKTSPTGAESVDLPVLREKVGADEELRKLQSDIQYELVHKRTKDEVYY